MIIIINDLIVITFLSGKDGPNASIKSVLFSTDVLKSFNDSLESWSWSYLLIIMMYVIQMYIASIS